MTPTQQQTDQALTLASDALQAAHNALARTVKRMWLSFALGAGFGFSVAVALYDVMSDAELMKLPARMCFAAPDAQPAAMPAELPKPYTTNAAGIIVLSHEGAALRSYLKGVRQ